MKRLASALALSACTAAALAQSTPPNAAPAAEGARQSVPPSTPGTATQQPPQRGFIAPVVDIRIQGDGISLPKPAPAAPAPEAEKPPAPQAK